MPFGFPDLDFEHFHRSTLPEQLEAGRAALAAPGLDGLEPLAFRVPEGEAFSYVPRPGGVQVVAGDAPARTVIELDAEAWQGLVHELETPPGLLYAGRARSRRGRAMDFVRWDPALRALYAGRPVFDPARARLEDADGHPLDPRRSFAADEDPGAMAEFLRRAGYLHVQAVFGDDEVALFRELTARLRHEARRGDRESWWAHGPGGEELVCRVTNAARLPELRPLPRDPRIARLVGLADADLAIRARGHDREVGVIYKSPGVADGLSDLPWHRDCGMGGHAVMCPVLIASVYLYEVSPASGELRFLPGSWQGACPFLEADQPGAPRGVGLAARPGDVSLHYGDVMHAAPPPTGPGPYRVSVVMAFARPGATHHRGERDYNDVLLGRADGQVEHLRDVARRA